MGRKKKVIEPPCLHCSVVFPIAVRWCPRCESHLGTDGWNAQQENCDRCVSGENDDYVRRKVGRADRIAKALKDAQDPKNWLKDGACEAYERWVNSPEYLKRFEHGH